MPHKDPIVKTKYHRQWRQKKTALIAAMKDVPCADCGLRYHPWQMQFDHVRGVKCFDLSKHHNKSMDSILEEISKTEVVCANCHADRTYRRLRER